MRRRSHARFKPGRRSSVLLICLMFCRLNVSAVLAASGIDKTRTVLRHNSKERAVELAESVERLIDDSVSSREASAFGERTPPSSRDRDDQRQPKRVRSQPPHQLCDESNSGGERNVNLEWSEPAHKLLPILDDYNSFVPPGALTGETTNVSVAVYIESMSSFKAQTMDFEVDMYLAMLWPDRRLAHNCTHPILITDLTIANRLWHPDLYFVNSKFAYLQEVTQPNFMVLIYPDGVVFKSMRVDVTLSCMMKLKRFPMDAQRCPMIIQSYAYVEQVMTLKWHIAPPYFPVAYNKKIRLNDMYIIDTTHSYCSGDYPMMRGSGRWSCILAHIVMQRRVVFHVIQTYVPTAMLVVISWMSFWLDARAAPARISLTITTLLTLTTMSNGARQDLPQVSYVKALDVWLSFCQAFVFCVLLEYTVVSFFITRRTSSCHHVLTARQMNNAYGHMCQKLLCGCRKGRRRRESEAKKAVLVVDDETLLYHKQTPIAANNATRDGNSNQLALLAGGPVAGGVNGGGPGPTPNVSNRLDAINKPCQVCQHRWEKTAKKIDSVSQYLFPSLYVIFICCYWILFLTGDDNFDEDD